MPHWSAAQVRAQALQQQRQEQQRQQAPFEPPWLAGPAAEIEEPAARQALQTIQQVPVSVAGFRQPLQTTFLGPGAYSSADGPP